MTERKVMVSAAFVAEFLGVHQNTVYREARKGNIPCVKIGSRYLFNRLVIERWATGEPEPERIQAKPWKGELQL